MFEQHYLPHPSLEQGSLELTEEYIRLRAYELFLKRGGEHGHDVEDWLQAEAEITGSRGKSAPRSAQLSAHKTVAA